MRPLLVLPVLVFALLAGRAAAYGPVSGPSPYASPAGLCRTAIAAAERAAGVPDRLMQAIGTIESGRRDEAGALSPYPWTINAEGVGSFYGSKAEAIAAVVALRAQGVRSIDVGCMQVNLIHHASAFAGLEEAFDPAANAQYAARFLSRLLAQTGSWPAATAAYHSMTPDIGAEYARKVLAVWAKPMPSGAAPGAEWPVPPAGSSFAAAAGLRGRVIPLPSGAGTAAVGRGLDSYRNAPTQLAARIVPARTSLNPG